MRYASKRIPVILCEAEPGLTHDLRAGAFHPPDVLEMMAPYGITERMLIDGIKVRHWQIRNKPGDLVAEFDLGMLADVTPFFRIACILSNSRLTPIQLDILRQEGGADIRFGCKINGFTQTADGVSVAVERGGEAETIEASWLIGADGGRAQRVRKATGIEFEGFTWPETFVVASTTHDFGAQGFAHIIVTSPIRPSSALCSRCRMTAHPDRGASPTQPTRKRPTKALLEAPRVEAALQRLVQKPAHYDALSIRAHTVFTSASQRRSDPAAFCLAGDAAHLNNPLGGFGLNSGIHDAVNLCDKLPAATGAAKTKGPPGPLFPPAPRRHHRAGAGHVDPQQADDGGARSAGAAHAAQGTDRGRRRPDKGARAHAQHLDDLRPQTGQRNSING